MGDRLATIDMGQSGDGLLWGLGPHWIAIQYNVAWVEANLFAKWHLDPSNRFATIVQLYALPRRNTLTDYFYP